MDEPLTKDGFKEWQDEQFRDAHASAREVLGMNQRRRKDQYWKEILRGPYATGDKVWVWAKERVKSKKTFDPLRCNGQDVRSDLQGGIANDSQ